MSKIKKKTTIKNIQGASTAIISSEIPTDDKLMKHLILSDVNGKNRKYKNVDFSYSIIERGYFHMATFEDCKFIGTRFIDSVFRSAEFRNCDFKYSDFSGTIVPSEQMFENLPDFPNNRRSLLQSLRKNAVSVGDYEAEKKIVLWEIAAKKDHLRSARQLITPYYKTKFGGWKKQTSVYLRSVGLWLENIIWGHGEKLFRFPLFLVGLSALLSVVHIICQTDIFSMTGVEIFKIALDVFLELLLKLVNVEIINPTKFNLFISVLIEVAKYLIWGVIAATLYRRLAHR